MENIDINTDINKNAGVNSIAETSSQAKSLELTMEYVLLRIDQIMNDTQHLKDALKVIPTILNSSTPGDSTGEQKAKAIASVVTSRETTNQQLIKLLEKMYDDLKPEKSGLKEKALGVLEKTINNAEIDVEEKTAFIDGFSFIVKHIND